MLHGRVDNPDTSFVRSCLFKTILQKPPDKIIADPGKILRCNGFCNSLQMILQDRAQRQESLISQKVRSDRQISFRLAAKISLHPRAAGPNRDVPEGPHIIARALRRSPNLWRIVRLFSEHCPAVDHFRLLSSHAIRF